MARQQQVPGDSWQVLRVDAPPLTPAPTLPPWPSEHDLAYLLFTSGSTTQYLDGAWTTSTTLIDSSGNTSAARAGEFILDTTPPAAPTGQLAGISDTGTPGDLKTNDNTPTLGGTAEANATVQIEVNGQTYTVTANAQGAWSLPATATLPDGTYTPVITVTDAAGNSSTANGTPFTVDATAPSTPTLTSAYDNVSGGKLAQLLHAARSAVTVSTSTVITSCRPGAPRAMKRRGSSSITMRSSSPRDAAARSFGERV